MPCYLDSPESMKVLNMRRKKNNTPCSGFDVVGVAGSFERSFKSPGKCEKTVVFYVPFTLRTG